MQATTLSLTRSTSAISRNQVRQRSCSYDEVCRIESKKLDLAIDLIVSRSDRDRGRDLNISVDGGRSGAAAATSPTETARATSAWKKESPPHSLRRARAKT
jgi:hypothetical protein